MQMHHPAGSKADTTAASHGGICVAALLILTSADLLDSLVNFFSVNSNSLFVCLLRYFLA